MRKYRSIVVAVTIAAICLWSNPARALSIKEEKQLGSEFLRYVRHHHQLVEDPMIMGYIEEIGQKILATMPAQPFTYHFYVIKEDVYNAFAVPAGHVFINSGLLAAMESEDELAGILGHEIAHVACRHISQRFDRSNKITLATMVGVVAGIFLGVATGDPAALQAVVVGSVAAGQTAALSYSRQDETQADDLGIQYLVKAGYNPRGLLTVLTKIRSKQWFGSNDIPTYMMTHPAVEERMAWIDNWIAAHPQAVKSVGPDKDPSAKILKKINTRLIALHEEPDAAVSHFQDALAKRPADINLIYGYGLALDRSGNRTEAIHQLKKALSKNAFDPFILSDLGRIYFTQGRLEESKNTLQGALSLTTQIPQARFYLGRACLDSGQPDKAAVHFEKLLAVHEDYIDGYYYLGETYTKLKQIPDAHYNIGIYHYKREDYRTARFHLTRARDKIGNPTKQKVIDKYLKTINERLKGMVDQTE